MEKISLEIFIDKIMKLFSNPNIEQLMEDMEIVKSIKDKSRTKYMNKFIEKYSKVQIDSKIATQMIREIISQLTKERKDFYVLMQIYLNISDSILTMDILKNHYILANYYLKIIENGNPVFLIKKEGKINYIEFGVDFHCLYNKEHYYHKFVKGIFHYFKLALEESYLYQFLEKEFLENLNSSEDYYESQSLLYNSLCNMLNDMNRVISKESNNSEKPDKKGENKIIDKMPKNNFRAYAFQCELHTSAEILKIYDDSATDDEIALKIDSLIVNNKHDDNFQLMLLKDNIENYLRSKVMEKRLEQLENFQEEISKDKAEHYFITKMLQDYEKEKEKEKIIEIEIEKIKKENAEMKSEINKLNNSVSILEKKVNFMEPVMFSLICRRAKNYCMLKVLEKYKNKIKVTMRYNDYGKKDYKITFIDNVNKISIEESNKLIDILFDKKDEYNDDFLLAGKNIPDFYKNIWNIVKQRFNLEKNELIAFDTIFDDKIRSEFNFGEEDISISDYLKGKDLKEFG